MSHIITVDKLVKKYKKAESAAVDAISFTVNEGEFFAFLGPNGAGKTTTISILTTTLAQTSGTVTIAGFDLDTQPSGVRQNIGVIFQNHSLDLNLTAEENLRMHACLYGVYPFRPLFSWMPKEYREQVRSLASIMGMEDKMFHKVKTFSGGMKRRFEIIRSLIHKPRVLFLDEPTSGLDPVSRKNLWIYLNEVRKKEKVTIFLTTHYLDEAEGADRVCIINKGKIVMTATPRELEQQLVQEYLIVDADDRAKLKSLLTSHGYDYSGSGPFHVALGAKTAQQVIQSITVPLTTLTLHQPTLEDAYIEIIGEQHA